MSYELREGSGILFVNDRKEKDTQPSHTGNVVINGVKKKLSAWKKEKNGKTFLSIQISDFTSAPNAVGGSTPSFIPKDTPTPAASDIPF